MWACPRSYAMCMLYECCTYLYALFFVSKGKTEISNLLNMPISVLWAVLKLSRNYLHCGCSFEHF